MPDNKEKEFDAKNLKISYIIYFIFIFLIIINFPQRNYVASIKSGKCHQLKCVYAGKIKAKNKQYFKTLEDASKAGFNSCGNCIK